MTTPEVLTMFMWEHMYIYSEGTFHIYMYTIGLNSINIVVIQSSLFIYTTYRDQHGLIIFQKEIKMKAKMKRNFKIKI
jgi:hypothetical protein